MATIKLGMLVTDIAGSIGGTTFRRMKNGHQMYNKPIGAARGRLLNNPALIVLNAIASAWSGLSTGDKDEWIAAALLFLFLDKFGDPVNITGYQFYIKNTNFNNAIGGAALDPPTFSDTVLTTGIFAGTLDDHDFASMEIDSTLLNTFILIQMYKVPNLNVTPAYLDYKVIAFKDMTASDTIVFTDEFIAQFPEHQVDEFYNIVVTFQNLDGFRSSPISEIVQVASS
jgi:hypothetical protein